MINILAADKLMLSPKMYATFLLWMLAELFETPARGGRSRQAQARLLLRRGPSSVHRRAGRPAPEDRADHPAHPVQGRGRLFRHPESRSTCRRSSSASSGTASSTPCGRSRRATRRPSGWPPRPCGQPQARHREGDHRAGGRRGARLVPRRKGPARDRRAGLRPAAAQPDRADRARHPPLDHRELRTSTGITRRPSTGSPPTRS